MTNRWARSLLMRPRWLVFFLALAVKATVLLSLRNHPLLEPRGDMDGAVYLSLAQNGMPHVVYYVSPLYLYFLELVHASINLARFAQLVLGAFAVVLAFDTAARWFSEKRAWITALLLIGCGVITFNEVTILQSSLDPFLIVLSLWLLTLALQRDEPRFFLATGAAAALFVLNRPNALLWMATLGLILLLQRRWRNAAAFALGCFLFLAPVALRNFVVGGQLVLVSSHGGLNFYVGNNAEADGTYHAVQGIRPTIAGQAVDAKAMAERESGRSLTPKEVSSWFYARAFDWIRAHPAAAMALFGRKLAYTLSNIDVSLNFSYDFFQHDVASPLRYLIVGPWLLVPLGVAGAMTRWRDRAFALWFLFVPVYAVSVALFFVASRYRLPLLIIFAIAAAGAVQARRMSQIFVAALFGVIAVFPFALDSGRSNEEGNMVVRLIELHRFDEAEELVAKYEANHRDPARLHFRAALALGEEGESQRQIAQLERVLAIPSAQPVIQAEATTRLAKAYARSGRNEEAKRLLAGFDGRSLNAAEADELGRIALDLHDASAAVRFLTVATARDAANSDDWQHLGVAYLASGAPAAAVAAFSRACLLAPRDPSAHLFLAMADAQSGQLDAARANASEALRLRPGFVEAERLLAELGKASS